MRSEEPVALYARISRETRTAVDQYAVARGLTLAAALQQLLNLGLETAHQRAAMDDLHAELCAVRDQLGAVERDRDFEITRRQRIESEYQALQNAAGVWTERASMQVGVCPACNDSLTGGDLLVSGRCSNCGHSAADLLTPPKRSGLDDKELMMVLGAAGLILGLVALAGKGGGGGLG